MDILYLHLPILYPHESEGREKDGATIPNRRRDDPITSTIQSTGKDIVRIIPTLQKGRTIEIDVDGNNPTDFDGCGHSPKTSFQSSELDQFHTVH